MIKRALLGIFMMVATALPSFAAEPGGTREEAIAMANAAKAFYLEHGLAEFKAAVQDPNNSEFHYKDLYVFAMNFDRIMLAHGANPALADKDMSRLRDPNGKDFTAEMIQVAQQGGDAWVDYAWTHPISKKAAPKSGYVVTIDDNLYLGVGIYTND